jgi:hypothetical protein
MAPPSKSNAGIVIGIVVAVLGGTFVVLVVAIIAIRFLGTSARTNFSSVGSAIVTADATTALPTTSTTAVDPGPFTVVIRPVTFLDTTPCHDPELPTIDASACVTVGDLSVPLKGKAEVLPKGDRWSVQVALAKDTSKALDALAKECNPTPAGNCPMGRIALVRVGTRSVVLSIPSVNTSSFNSRIAFTGYDEQEAKDIAALIKPA